MVRPEQIVAPFVHLGTVHFLELAAQWRGRLSLEPSGHCRPDRTQQLALELDLTPVVVLIPPRRIIRITVPENLEHRRHPVKREAAVADALHPHPRRVSALEERRAVVVEFPVAPLLQLIR